VGRPRWRSRVDAAFAAALATALLAACSGTGSSALTDPHDIPPDRPGPPTDVSVCDLVPLAQASATLGSPLSVVGKQYGPSRVPTFACLVGDEFGVARLTVELAVGPVAWNVFLAAYGDRAGGDPKPVRRLGALAYLRNEKDESSLHVFVRGAIVSLRLVRDPARPVRPRSLLDIARLIVQRLPRNPRLAGTTAGAQCSAVSNRIVGAAIGIEPSRAVGDEVSGSLMCSWASFPGSVDVTVIRDPERVASYRATIDPGAYVSVRGIDAADGVIALSRSNRPGDILLFDHGASMALISVIPSAGSPDDQAITTPDEIALARQVASALM
jgi:hypothetical protein